MADPLRPLFETLGVEAVNASMNRILTDFLRSHDVLTDNPIIVVNHYAYYNGSVRLGPMLRIVLGIPWILKRMLSGAVKRWTEVGRPRYVENVETLLSRPWRALSNQDLLGAVQQLEEAAIDAYGSMVSGVIPAAWMSEAWFTFVCRLVGRRDDPAAPTYLMGFESLPIHAEKKLYGLAQWVNEHAALADYLRATPSAELVGRLWDHEAPEGVSAHVWEAWQERLQAYLSEFGHMIYNLDFSNPVLSDDPTPAMETLRMFLEGQGTDPHVRQAQAVSRRVAATRAMEQQLEGLRLRVFRWSMARAQRFAPLREDALADVGLGYPLVRQMLLTLGGRLVEMGIITADSDIFWLTKREVEVAARRLDRGELRADAMDEAIAQRKAIWLAARMATPPVMLPQLKIFGAKQAWLKWWRGKTRVGNRLKGVGASPGSAVGPACLVHGPEDFGRMITGDILVAPLTTPAWTPLFARAAGIVTDVGGPLSHGSIVAREYGVPAVLGTGDATARIANRQTILVDGSEGTVILSPREQPAGE
jgi:phosphohistidine swiveling domain-containing protein